MRKNIFEKSENFLRTQEHFLILTLYCIWKAKNEIESDIDRTHRTHISEYYRGAVFGLLEDNSDIPYLEKIFRIDNSRPACYQKGEIIEQLGRMLVQDGYSEDSVIEAATIAAKLYRMGYTVKEIKAYLIRVRKTGSW